MGFKGWISKQFKFATLAILFLSGLSGCDNVRLQSAPPEIIEKVIHLQIENYCPTEGYNFREIFAFNASTYNVGDHHVLDFDRDGLSDAFEQTRINKDIYNISALNADTNGDGYSDFLVQFIGYEAQNQVLLRTCVDPAADTDRDGLLDCEEAVLRTHYLTPDSDGDGLPDGLEYRFGTNPTDPADAMGDLDQDGLTNLEEIKVGTPIHTTNSSRIQRKALTFTVDTRAVGNAICYTIDIGNIALLKTSNGNLIRVFAVESKTLNGQGDIQRIKTLALVVPESQLTSGTRVTAQDIDNQVIELGHN